MRIRLAERADVPAIERVVDSAYARWVGPVGRRPGPMDDDYVAEVENGRVHVLEDDERIVGLIVLLECDDHLLVQNIAVAPGCQGQGHGKRLLEFAESEAQRIGVPEMRLYTHEKMDTNIAWYTRHGWIVQRRAEEDQFRRVFFVKSAS